MKLLTPALLLLLAFPAAADVVRLKNGSSLEGKATVNGDTVVVEMDFGSVTVKRSDVTKITYDISPIQELDRRIGETKMDDADAVYKLGVWAKQHELETRSKELFKRVITLNPDHEKARGELGYRKFENRWLSDEDWHAANGEVKYGGAWMKREEVEKLQLAKDESEGRRRLDNRIVEAQAELLKAQAELTRAQAAAERTRAEIEKETLKPRVVYIPVVAGGTVHTHTVYGWTYQCCCSKAAATAKPPADCQKK